MARDQNHERVVRCLERLLKTIMAGTGALGYWYTPSRVLVVGGYPNEQFEQFLDQQYPVSYLVAPGFERGAGTQGAEEATGLRRYEATIELVLMRFLGQPDDPPSGLGQVIASGPWASGAQDLLGQPAEANLLRCRLEDPENLVTAGTLTAAGLDQDGAALSLDWSPLTDGRDALQHSSWRMLASVTSVSIAGALGGGPTSRFSVSSRPDRSTIQSRMAADVDRLIGDNPQLGGCATLVENVFVADVERRLYTPGWAIVGVTLTAIFNQRRGC